MSKLHLAAVAASVSLLVACGGGGGTASAPTPLPLAAKAEGVYAGTLVSGGVTGAFQAVVLEDDSLWALYGVAGTGGSLLVQGFTVTTGTSGNGTFSVTGKDYGFSGGVLNTTGSGTYTPGVSITGTSVSGSTTASFTGTTAAITGYSYSTPAQTSAIVGTWSGSASPFGVTTSVNIAANGSFTGISGTCAISGTLTPRSSNKNIFNATYSNGTAGCAAPNLSAQGIGVASTLSNGKQQLIVILTNADKSIGVVAFVTK